MSTTKYTLVSEDPPSVIIRDQILDQVKEALIVINRCVPSPETTIARQELIDIQSELSNPNMTLGEVSRLSASFKEVTEMYIKYANSL